MALHILSLYSHCTWHCKKILYLHIVKPKTCYQTANLKNKIQPEIIPPTFEMIFRIQVTNLNWNEGKSDFKKLPLSKKNTMKLQELSITKTKHTIKL